MTKNLVVTLSSQGGCINNNVLDEKATTELSSQESIYMELERHDDSCQSEWFRILAIKIKEGLCCIALWNGLAMMLFYQFGGYNVVTFYASEIIRGDMEDGHEKACCSFKTVMKRNGVDQRKILDDAANEDLFGGEDVSNVDVTQFDEGLKKKKKSKKVTLDLGEGDDELVGELDELSLDKKKKKKSKAGNLDIGASLSVKLTADPCREVDQITMYEVKISTMILRI